MGEQQRVAVGGERALDHAVGAGGELLERLAVRDVVAPDVPARALDADVLRGAALVVAVLALAQVVVGLGASPKPASSAVRRARCSGEVRTSANSRPSSLGATARGLPLALLGEREVGEAGVAPGAAPLGLAVADEDDLAAHSFAR